MKQIILIVLFILTSGFIITAEITIPLPDISRPSELKVFNGFIFIPDQYSALVIDLTNKKNITRICSKGEGPFEDDEDNG